MDNGSTNLGQYNDAAVNGGDIADWVYNPSFNDAFTAISGPGSASVTTVDWEEVAALGYTEV